VNEVCDALLLKVALLPGIDGSNATVAADAARTKHALENAADVGEHVHVAETGPLPDVGACLVEVMRVASKDARIRSSDIDLKLAKSKVPDLCKSESLISGLTGT
jgi:hypothetical protein